MAEISVGAFGLNPDTTYTVAYDITKEDALTTKPLEAAVVVRPPVRDNRSQELISSILVQDGAFPEITLADTGGIIDTNESTTYRLLLNEKDMANEGTNEKNLTLQAFTSILLVTANQNPRFSLSSRFDVPPTGPYVPGLAW